MESALLERADWRIDEVDPREAWARAVAGDDTRLRVGEDFGADGARASWPAQLPERTPYAVRLADAQRRYRVIALDFDASRDLEPGDAARQAAAVSDVLRAIGVSHVVCASDGTADGGRHLFIRLRRSIHAQVAHRIVRAIAQSVHTLDVAPMLNPREGCIRPPLAPHKRGGSSRVLRCAGTGADSIDAEVPAGVALEVFERGNPKRAVEWICAAFRVPRRSRSLSKLDEALRSAQPAGKDQTPSAVVMRVVRLAAIAGLGPDALLERADRLNGFLADKLRRPHGASPRRVDYEYARLPHHTPGERPERILDPQVERVLTDWTRVLALELWQTQPEYRQRELLRILIGHAARLNTLEVRRALSDLADDLGCSKSVAHGALNALRTRLPELKYERAGIAKDAASVRFTPLSREIPTSSSTAGQAPVRGRVCVRNLPPSDPRRLGSSVSDLFASHVQGAGPRGAQIIDLLRHRPHTTAELAEALALRDADHVRRYHLANLHELGLVERHGSGTWYVTSRLEEADRIALDRGCTRRPAARRRRHADERLDRREQRYGSIRDRHISAALRLIEARPDGVTPAQLQHALGLQSPSLTRDVIAQLAKHRLIQRRGERIVTHGTPCGRQLALPVVEAPAGMPSDDRISGLALDALQDGPTATRDLAERLGVPSWKLVDTLLKLRDQGSAHAGADGWTLGPAAPQIRLDRRRWLDGLPLIANRALQSLHDEGPQPLHELAARLRVRTSDLTDVAQRMEDTGCIVRHDARSWAIHPDLARGWTTGH